MEWPLRKWRDHRTGYINEHLGVESRVYDENSLVGNTVDLLM